MTVTDCDVLVKIFNKLKYNNEHDYSRYSCCDLDNIKCSESHTISSITLSNMKIKKEMKFPKYISQLKNLTSIDINNNMNITRFPDLQNKNFKKINLSYTSISQPFPEWIIKQKSLKELDLSNTRITEKEYNGTYLFQKNKKM